MVTDDDQRLDVRHDLSNRPDHSLNQLIGYEYYCWQRRNGPSRLVGIALATLAAAFLVLVGHQVLPPSSTHWWSAVFLAAPLMVAAGLFSFTAACCVGTAVGLTTGYLSPTVTPLTWVLPDVLLTVIVYFASRHFNVKWTDLTWRNIVLALIIATVAVGVAAPLGAACQALTEKYITGRFEAGAWWEHALHWFVGDMRSIGACWLAVVVMKICSRTPKAPRAIARG